MKPYSNTGSTPIWFGVSESDWYVGGASLPSYTNGRQLALGYINHGIYSDEIYDIVNKKSFLAWRKVKTGELKTEDKDYIKMTLNGENVNSTYSDAQTITANIVDSQAEIGRRWQYNNENRTSNCSIQAIRVYNRVLSDEEIKINYEIDEYRFGITK